MPEILLTVYMTLDQDGWKATAYADKTYEVVKPTKDEAKSAFLDMWNEAKNSNVLAENVDYVDPV